MIYLVLFSFCLLLSASFSALETAFVTANPLKIYSKIPYNQNIGKILFFFNQRDLVINTILVGNNIANISAGILLLLFFEQKYPYSQALAISTGLSTFFILIFGEILPKSFSLKYSSQIVMHLHPLLRFYAFILYPFSRLMSRISRFFFKPKEKEDFISREEVEFLFYKEENEKETSEDERDFISRVFNLSTTSVKEIMIPLNDVMRVEISDSKELVLKKIEDNYYSRLAVYENEAYNILGYIESKSFIYGYENKVEKALLKTLFFPETKPVDEALFEMQKHAKPLAFVVDEYGAVSGMITKEDLLELIVGNIEDEMHHDESMMPTQDGWIVPGWENVDHLNSRLGLEIEKQDFETLSGFAAFILHKIPEKGDRFTHAGFEYTVLETRNRVAEKIQIIFRENR